MKTQIGILLVLAANVARMVCAEPIPAHAHKDLWGTGWECDQGYYRSGSGCEKVLVPENASLDYFGHDWECNRGFYKYGNECRPVLVPKNASLDYYGHEWECDRGFYKYGNECRPVLVPKNASLDYYGHEWECNRGFKKIGDRCEEIVVPANASLDYFGTGWVCNSGYVKRGNGCITVSQATDDEVRELMITESIASYPGNCPCPYFTDRAGRRCGGRSAYSRAGGYSPLCYKGDISDAAVKAYRARQRH